MPDASLWFLIAIIVLAIGFGVSNGFNDAANAVAPVIGTRVLSPRNAILLSFICNFAGAATGLAVAKTIGKGILIPEATTYLTVIAALASVIIWTSVASFMGLPVSLSHGFIAALASAGIAAGGLYAVNWGILGTVFAAVFTAPVLGFIGGFLMMVLFLWIFRRYAPSKLHNFFAQLQILATAFLSYTHGKNDGQMPIGVIAMALVIYYQANGNAAQAAAVWEEIAWGNLWWVVILAALSISMGTLTGGWRVIKTLGMKVTTLRPINGFAAQAAAAMVIEGASLLGIPVSTTHCISSSIMGVGATKRLSAVRWGIAHNIFIAWIVTFPICGGLGYGFALLLKPLFG